MRVVGRGARRSPVERQLPFLGLAIAIGLLVLILPTALRPPPDRANSGAELSPDAPPDDAGDSIVEALARAASPGAGGGGATADGAPGAVGVDAGLAAAPDAEPPRAPRSQCFGNPPRQVESVYAPPCVPRFVGDNGGATARGVTASDIRIAILCAATGCGREGEVTDASAGNSYVDRTVNDLRKYFNSHLELYGRQLRFFVVEEGDSDDEAQQRAMARRAVDQYDAFAAYVQNGFGKIDTLARLGVPIITGGFHNQEVHRELAPYVWASTSISEDSADFGSDYLCKKLVGRTPFPTGDALIDYSSPRTFGLISNDSRRFGSTDTLLRFLDQRCGVRPDPVIRYTGLSDNSVATAVARLRQANVSTVIYHADLFTAVAFTHMADQNQYRPEWFITGFGGMEVPTVVRSYSPSQWRNAFGISLEEVAMPPGGSECARAIRAVDPGFNPPTLFVCDELWVELVQLLGAIQMTGPDLTADHLTQTIPHLPGRLPDASAPWAMAGSFGPTDWSYSDFAVEMWWDPAAMHPDGKAGAYRHPNCGRRYERGGFTTEPSAAFTPDSVTGLQFGACQWSS